MNGRLDIQKIQRGEVIRHYEREVCKGSAANPTLLANIREANPDCVKAFDGLDHKYKPEGR